MSIHETMNPNGSITTTIITRHQSDEYDNININIIISENDKVISDIRSEIPIELFKNTIYNLEAIYGN
jgi:hypothetical protein